jgi:hypothetical protein
MHVLYLMTKLIEDVGFDINEEDLEGRMIFRGTVMTNACNLGHETCLTKSMELFETWVNNVTL